MAYNPREPKRYSEAPTKKNLNVKKGMVLTEYSDEKMMPALQAL